jgi:hypothetical protein
MFCVVLIERAAAEHNVNADSMLVGEVYLSDRKTDLRIVGVEHWFVVDCQVSSRAVKRVELPKRRWREQSHSRHQGTVCFDCLQKRIAQFSFKV